MFVTIDTLKKLEACNEGIEFFQRFFPDGAELIDVINHRFVSLEMLHWGFLHLSPNEEEVMAYWKKLEVVNSDKVYHSDHITDSEIITRSNHITQSRIVRASTGITNSQVVISSNDVEDSTNIFNSNFVYQSHEVLNSQNVTNSHNVVGSIYVVDSDSIYCCEVITDSRHCRNSTNLADSLLCSECNNLSHAMFCAGIDGGEYLLFNKPIAPKQFEMLRQRYNTIATEFTNLAGPWPRNASFFPNPIVEELNWQKQYLPLPEKLWEWAKTLPNYDAMLLYRITFISALLQ